MRQVIAAADTDTDAALACLADGMLSRAQGALPAASKDEPRLLQPTFERPYLSASREP